MGDVYKEQIIKKTPTAYTYLAKAGIIGAAAGLFLLSLIFLPQIAVLVLMAAIFFAYYLLTFLNVEYEYIVTNDLLEIDCIYNKSRRNHVFSGSLKEIHSFAPLSMADRSSGIAVKTIDCSGTPEPSGKYVFITSHKGAKARFVIEPDNKILDVLRHRIPTAKLARDTFK